MTEQEKKAVKNVQSIIEIFVLPDTLCGNEIMKNYLDALSEEKRQEELDFIRGDARSRE